MVSGIVVSFVEAEGFVVSGVSGHRLLAFVVSSPIAVGVSGLSVYRFFP